MTAKPPGRMTAAEYRRLAGTRSVSTPTPAGPAKKKKTRAETKRNQAARPPKIVTPRLEVRSRGPWLLEVDNLGRPMTINDERTSVLNRATMAAVRAEKGAWAAGFAAAALDCRIPRLARVYLVFQPFYPTGVVPDPDGLSPLHKTAIDALVAAGVLADDSRAQLPAGYHVLPPVTDGGPARMVLAVFPLP